MGQLKLNIDGCSKGNPGIASVGGIFRNDTGEWVCSFLVNMGVATITQAELRALWVGMRLAVDMNVTELAIESDSKVIVDYMAKNDTRNNALSALV